MTDNPWKTATFVMGGLLVLQFWWWNKQAPEVLNLGNPRRGTDGYLEMRRFR